MFRQISHRVKALVIGLELPIFPTIFDKFLKQNPNYKGTQVKCPKPPGQPIKGEEQNELHISWLAAKSFWSLHAIGTLTTHAAVVAPDRQSEASNTPAKTSLEYSAHVILNE